MDGHHHENPMPMHMFSLEKKRKKLEHFANVAPMTRSARMKLFEKDPSCFLLPPMRGEMPKYPICDKKGKKLCQGVLSAKMRADLVKTRTGDIATSGLENQQDVSVAKPSRLQEIMDAERWLRCTEDTIKFSVIEL